MAVRIKVCCISSAEEARVALEYGASALGLVGYMPSGPGVISDELIFSIARQVPPPIGTFLLTNETAASAIIEHHPKTATNTIQLVDALTEGNYQQIRTTIPGIKLVQVIHVLDERAVDEALEMAEQADALLLGSGNPNFAVISFEQCNYRIGSGPVLALF